MVSRGAQAFLIPSPEAVNELAARSVTSPRLPGEVEIRAPARGFRVRGKRFLGDSGLL